MNSVQSPPILGKAIARAGRQQRRPHFNPTQAARNPTGARITRGMVNISSNAEVLQVDTTAAGMALNATEYRVGQASSSRKSRHYEPPSGNSGKRGPRRLSAHASRSKCFS